MKWFIKNFELLVSSISFTVMLLMIIINVFARFFFGHSFSSSEEIAFLGFTYCVFFGACVLYKKHALIAIDIVVERLPQKAKHAVTIFNFALLTVGNIYLIYLSTKLSISAWIRPTAALRIPYTFIDISATMAFTIMSYYSIKFLINAIRGIEMAEVSLEDRK